MEKKLSHRAIVALGSNSIDGETILDTALAELSAKGINLARSTRRLWTEPIASNGKPTSGDKFINGLVAIDTNHDYQTLNYILKEVEHRLGASKADKKRGKVLADLDILAYDSERHHLDDWQRNYIQTLIQEL